MTEAEQLASITTIISESSYNSIRFLSSRSLPKELNITSYKDLYGAVI